MTGPTDTGIEVIFIETPTDVACTRCNGNTGLRTFFPVVSPTGDPLCPDCVRATGPQGDPLVRLLDAFNAMDAALFLTDDEHRDAVCVIAIGAYRGWASTRFGHLLDTPSDTDQETS